jgi:DNA-binding MarR family transcriptional regulator
MQSKQQASGYWYADDDDSQRATSVLNSMRRYRAAEAEMRRRTRVSMGMGETDLAAIRYLVQAEKAGRSVSPKEISDTLGISTASTTKLVDRLVKSGHVERRPHPTDRRGLIIAPTWDTELEVRSTLASMHARMLEVAESLAPDDARAITAFLERMTRAIEVDDQARGAADRRGPAA